MQLFLKESEWKEENVARLQFFTPPAGGVTSGHVMVSVIISLQVKGGDPRVSV